MRPRPTCYNKALDLLSRRGHFRRELEYKLRRREYSDEEIAAAFEKLEERRFLDDRALAKEYVQSRLRRRPMGPLKLRAELRERGVEDDAIDEALASFDAEWERELATHAAASWRRSKPRGRRDALARHLGSRGFGAATIGAVLASVRDDE